MNIVLSLHVRLFGLYKLTLHIRKKTVLCKNLYMRPYFDIEYMYIRL